MITWRKNPKKIVRLLKNEKPIKLLTQPKSHVLKVMRDWRSEESQQKLKKIFTAFARMYTN